MLTTTRTLILSLSLALAGCGYGPMTETQPDAGHTCTDVRPLGTLDWCSPQIWLTLPESAPDLEHLDILLDGVLLPHSDWHVCTAHYCYGRAIYVDVCSPEPLGLRAVSYSYRCE